MPVSDRERVEGFHRLLSATAIATPSDRAEQTNRDAQSPDSSALSTANNGNPGRQYSSATDARKATVEMSME